jgi:hypothetical protein
MKGDETIRMIEIVLAIALLAVPAMASSADVLGTYGGIFETEESAFNFPASQDTNIESLTVGNEKAMAFNNIWQKIGKASATNNLEIKKNQESGDCDCCQRGLDCVSPSVGSRVANHTPCKDCCVKVNLDQISAGNREAFAFGHSSAENYVKIVTNQK